MDYRTKIKKITGKASSLILEKYFSKNFVFLRLFIVRGFLYSLPWLRLEIGVNEIVLCGFFSTVKRLWKWTRLWIDKGGNVYGSNSVTNPIVYLGIHNKSPIR